MFNISDWANVANNDIIINEIIAAISSMFENQGGIMEDSIIMYFPKNFKVIMDRDYKSGFPSKSVKDRAMEISDLKEIKYAEKLADGEVIFVEMEDRAIQLAVASDIIAVPHVKTTPMASQNVTTYAAMVQIIKEDSQGNTGILHCTQ